MKKNRIIKVNDEIQKEIAGIIRGELNDPRIHGIVSVVNVDTTADLKFCKVHIGVLGDEKTKEEVFESVKNAGGYIRKLIAERINLRQTPQLIFVFDDSLERSIYMAKLIDEVNKNNENSN